MPKPSSVPGWTASGTEPSAPKKAAGWAVAEKPPAQTFNWFWTLVSSWLAYLDGLYGEAITWTASHIFNLNLTVNGILTVTTFNATNIAWAAAKTRNVMLAASEFQGGTNNSGGNNWKFMPNVGPGAEDPVAGAWRGPEVTLSGIVFPALLAKVPVPPGATITELSVHITKSGAAVNASLVGKKYDPATGTWTTRYILAATALTSGVTTPIAVPANTVDDGESVEVQILPSGTIWNQDAITVFAARVKYTHTDLAPPT